LQAFLLKRWGINGLRVAQERRSREVMLDFGEGRFIWVGQGGRVALYRIENKRRQKKFENFQNFS
jgi:hypothetical protein